MKIKILSAVSGLLLTAMTFAYAGQEGNGGGGVIRNGRYMTFYSAGFYTEPLEATSDEVPQLPELIEFFYKTPFMSELTKVKYAAALIPTGERHYFKVQSSTFTPETRARLIAEYGRVMNINTNEVALFAITDISSKTTYLLPEYFSLKPNEQKAVLFHEVYWLLKKDAGYKSVIDAEMAFQAYLEYPSSSERLMRWLELSGSTSDVLQAVIQIDFSTGAIKKLITDKNKIPSKILFGEKYFECRRKDLDKACMAFWNTNLYELAKSYPNSLFVRYLHHLVAGGRVYITNYWLERGFSGDHYDRFYGGSLVLAEVYGDQPKLDFQIAEKCYGVFYRGCYDNDFSMFFNHKE